MTPAIGDKNDEINTLMKIPAKCNKVLRNSMVKKSSSICNGLINRHLGGETLVVHSLLPIISEISTLLLPIISKISTL